jgi:hypothetical protein
LHKRIFIKHFQHVSGMDLGNTITQELKAKGQSRDDLAAQVGTSGAIIGAMNATRLPHR